MNGFFFCGIEKINDTNSTSVVKPNIKQMIARQEFYFAAIKTIFAKINTTRAIEIELNESGSYRYWYLVTSANPYSFP